MENNAAMVVDSLLAKFGTTMDRLMPAIIDFGRYECRHTIRVCTYMILIGIIFMIVSYMALKRHWVVGFDGELIMDFLFVVGLIMVVISVAMIVICLATLQKWNDFPEVMAYKYIFGLMR